jgi:hypothetical protein
MEVAFVAAWKVRAHHMMLMSSREDAGVRLLHEGSSFWAGLKAGLPAPCVSSRRPFRPERRNARLYVVFGDVAQR